MLGGVLGHGLCTGLAVLGGRMIAQKISVKTGNLTSTNLTTNVYDQLNKILNFSDARWWSGVSHICCVGPFF